MNAVLKALKKILPSKEQQAPSAAPQPQPETKPATSQTAARPVQAANKQRNNRKGRPNRKPRQAASDSWSIEDFVVEPAEGKTRFHDFQLRPELMRAIQALGFPYCTPIQAQVLGHTLKGHDAIGRAQTGTGKTAAFLISTISQLLENPPPDERYMGEPRALIIAPTRELVM